MQHDYISLLISSAQQGRKNSFIELCELSAKKIYNICLRMLSNEPLAISVSKEIFMQAWENIKFIREDISFDLWLKGITVYTILDEIRTKSRFKKLSSKEKNMLPDTSKSKEKLEAMILSLPEKERVLFVLHEIENYTYSEIHDFLSEYPLSEIKFYIRETRRKLCEALCDEL